MHIVNFINGKYVPKGVSGFYSINPSTEEKLHFVNTSSNDVYYAVDSAKQALQKWRGLSRFSRAYYIKELLSITEDWKTPLSKMISLETGKSLNESNAEVVECIHMLEYCLAKARDPVGKLIASELAEKEILEFRKPKGVVAVIAPWNFPSAILGFWTTAPSLLEGNTVVMKPSELTPGVADLITQMYYNCNFPPGVVNTVYGDGSIGEKLVKHDDVNHICFTGSAEVGKLIRLECAQHHNKSCSLEMGSKSAVIVFEDADIDLAVKCGISSAFKLSGQRCVSAGRILIQQGIYDEFCYKFADKASKLIIGNPFEQEIDYGPLISKSQMDKVLRYNEMTLDTDVLLKGTRLDRKGYFLTPHVYKTTWNHKLITLREEVFGPHVALIPFSSKEEASHIYNDTNYGLSMSVITKDYTVAKYMRDNCDFGLGYMNLPCVGAESHVNFGGIKGSGYGGGSAAGTFEAVTNSVTWTTNFDSNDFKFCQGLK